MPIGHLFGDRNLRSLPTARLVSLENGVFTDHFGTYCIGYVAARHILGFTE